MNCEKTQLLLSKYADNEASQGEREAVRAHIAGCAECARKLNEFEHVSAIFVSSATRPPEPQLRVGVFREINLMKEEERRKQRQVREMRPWRLPIHTSRRGASSVLSWVWAVVNPISVGMVAVLAFFGLMLYTNSTAPGPKLEEARVVNLPPAPTAPAPQARLTDNGATAPLSGSPIPGVRSTKIIPATFLPDSETGLEVSAIPATFYPEIPKSATMLPQVLTLSDPTPVLEDLDTSGTPTHLVRDPLYGYSIYYPSNWWTQTNGGVRYFRPWAMGGIDFLPYWIELHIDPNSEDHNATTYNQAHLQGAGTLITGSGRYGMRLSHTYTDDGSENSYHDLYSFDSQFIYTLHLVVPRSVQPASYTRRWYEAESILSGMSARTNFTRGSSRQRPGDDVPVLFLNGADLYTVSMNGQQSRAVTNGGYNVRQFVLSPDMRYIALTSAQKASDLWAMKLYVADLEREPGDSPQLLWDNAIEIHDVAWYSDRVLLALAKGVQGPGLYRIALPENGRPFDPATMIQLITPLGDSMAGAKSLAVSPDRQLITFLAPIGEKAGTNIYSVRPDGSDLQMFISHSAPLSPMSPPDSDNAGNRVLGADDQAIKSYVWLDGHMELGGYRFNLLYTCGNSLSPSLHQGGFIYSAPSANRFSLLGGNQLSSLGVNDPTRLQIVHMAYSTNNKLAITGYYNDYDGRADKLAGLWTADVLNGQISNLRSQRIPQAPDGITDLQWSPDNSSLIYRETIPQDPVSLSSRYYGRAPFLIIRQDIQTGSRTILYDHSQN